MSWQPIVFTDLDGTLLDHHTYSADPAIPLLKLLDAQQVPVIFTSSKTAAEIEQLRDQLGNRHPFICENGAGAYIPMDYFKTTPTEAQRSGSYLRVPFVEERGYWLDLLSRAPNAFSGKFRGFSEMGEAGICNASGLDAEQAALANQRDFGEPVQWLGSESEKSEFIIWLRSIGATVLEGGRFIHVSGGANKGKALGWLQHLYQENRPETHFRSLALGDGENDVAMLEAADFAGVVRSPVNPFPKLTRPTGVLYSEAFGPEGWCQALETIFQQTFSRDGQTVARHGETSHE